MSAEFQMPSPLFATRERQFVRYCKQHTDGSWAIVDVSLDTLRPGATASSSCGRRRPSGCLIRELPNGYSRVTWVEHAEASDAMVHELYLPLARSGEAFSARRWSAALERQCERLASAMSCAVPPPGGAVTSAEGRRSMLRLAERMVASFCAGVTASATHRWTTLSGSGEEDVRVTTRKSVDDPGRPPGIILNAATSFWLPVPPARIFGFLRDDATRSEWDILSNGGDVQEMAHIANGRDQGNAVSLLRVNVSLFHPLIVLVVFVLMDADAYPFFFLIQIWLYTAERELEPEQHADLAGVSDGRHWVICDLRARGRGGHERGAQRRRPRLRGAAAIGLCHPPRRRPRGVAAHRGVPDTCGLRAHRQALARLCGNCQQPHRLHRRPHQGRCCGRQGRGEGGAASRLAHRRPGPGVVITASIHGQYQHN